MRLDVFDLQLFIDILDCGSLTEAAHKNALTVQACSSRLKKLEQRFGKLLIRRASGLQPTAAGRIFAQHGTLMLQQYQQLQHQLLAQRQQPSVRLALWCNSSVQNEYLPAILPQYLLAHPQLRIELHEAESSEILRKLRCQQASLAILSDIFECSDLHSAFFAADPLRIICARQHPLAAKTEVALSDCLDYDWVGLMAHHAIQKSIDLHLASLGHRLQYRLQLSDFANLIQVVSQGLGIAIVSARIAERFADQFEFHQLSLLGKWANRNLILACSSQPLDCHYQALYDYLLAARQQF